MVFSSMLHDKPPAADIQTLHLDDFNVISVLGRGGKGVVFLVQNKTATRDLFALKVISRSSIEKRKNRGNNSDGSEYKRVCFEQEVLRRFDHPLLPKLHGVLWTDKIVGYAIDYCPGGDLHSLRMKLTEKMFSDDVIRFYAAELVLALEYLHGLGIVYRDLKPDNVMIQENGHLMLVDFDLSTKLSAKPQEPHISPIQKPNLDKKKTFPRFKRRSNSGVSPDNTMDSYKTAESDSAFSKAKSFVGTDEYMAPEMIQGKGHDYAVDSWCLGVMLYEMLYGTTPFKGINRKETYYRILAKSPELIGEMTPLRDLIGKLLEKDPKQRISVDKIKGHEFFRGIDWNLVVEVTRPPLIPVEPCVRDMEGNNGIDVELFVQGVFKVHGEKQNEVGGFKNELPNQSNNFLVF